ncbi:unnamed protein product [marine sediment metagenome]|uniref:Uncharacterized protein n=1 Tax=marine sediment metagenome TaxID=412755 RepID=X1BVR9_9ZZZZ
MLKDEDSTQNKYLNMIVLTQAAVKGRSTAIGLMAMIQVFSEKIMAQSSDFDISKLDAGNGQHQDDKEASKRERQ